MTLPGFCLRQVADVHGYRYCFQHRSGPPEWTWQLLHGFPAPRGRSYKNPRHAVKVSRAARTAADYAGTWANDPHWLYAVDQTAYEALGWLHHQRSRRRATLTMCQALAKQAQAILDAQDDATEVLADLARKPLGILPTPLAKIIAKKFAEKMVDLAVGTKLAATARALRCYGIFICAADEQVDLGQCYCLAPLVKSEIKSAVEDEVKAVVTQGMQPLLPARERDPAQTA